ncbi:FG-GAP repeat domain-containing protein [Streptomyces sp. NPDC050504]|uniref:FG-GAP repeat domain-containing protein n=1 Tax=Streptomyces sp. NPDC050504 TaxID=3365618 RepID=UPI0037AB8B68
MRRTGIATAAGCAALLLLAGCSGSGDGGQAASRSAADGKNADGKNGDAPPTALAAQHGTVPPGKGSRVPSDFNGDGHRDLVVNDLLKPPGDAGADDAGIGIVYGSAGPLPVDPAVRQLLSPRRNAAPSGRTLPSAFDAQTACDLDGDGFSDLVIATDPPYNGVGRPPVPLQLLFGSPAGLTGRAVPLRIPDRARFGNDWPDHPVCGDFDGDGAQDLAVAASEGRVSFLRGPFARTGAPRAADAPIPGAGPYLSLPAPAADTDGDGYDDLAYAPSPGATPRLLLGGPRGPRTPGGAYRPAAVAPDVIAEGEFDARKHRFRAVHTRASAARDEIALYPQRTAADTSAPSSTTRPTLTFSTAIFLK